MVNDDGSVVFSPEQFESFNWNLGEIYAWVKEARFQLNKYRECLETND